jgi:hypothetical protein
VSEPLKPSTPPRVPSSQSGASYPPLDEWARVHPRAVLVGEDELFTPLQGGNWHLRWYRARNELISARSYQVNGCMVAASLLDLADGTWTNATDHVIDPRKPVVERARVTLTVPPWAMDGLTTHAPPPLPNMVMAGPASYGWDMPYREPFSHVASDVIASSQDDDMDIDDDHVVKHVPRPPLPYHVPAYSSYPTPRRPVPPRQFRSRDQLQALLPTLTSPVPSLILPNLDEYQARDVFKSVEPFEPVILFLEQHTWYIAFLTAESRDQALMFMNGYPKLSTCFKLIPEKERRLYEPKPKYRPREERANGHSDPDRSLTPASETKNSPEIDERQVLNLLLRDLKSSTWQQVHRMVIENTVGLFVDTFIKSHLSKRVSIHRYIGHVTCLNYF